jgi:hypothetical protein
LPKFFHRLRIFQGREAVRIMRRIDLAFQIAERKAEAFYFDIADRHAQVGNMGSTIGIV